MISGATISRSFSLMSRSGTRSLSSGFSPVSQDWITVGSSLSASIRTSWKANLRRCSASPPWHVPLRARRRRCPGPRSRASPAKEHSSLFPCRSRASAPAEPGPRRRTQPAAAPAPRVPGTRSCSVALIPAPMRHHHECSAHRLQPT